MSIPIDDTDRMAFALHMKKTRDCMDNLGKRQNNIVCETAYLSPKTDFTFHTHPNGTPYPSDVDRDTTHNLKKKFLIIGLIPTNEIVVFEKEDDFTRLVDRFELPKIIGP